MTKIKLEKCVELLYKLHTYNVSAWEISKNQDLTDILEEQKELLERMIKTMEDAIDAKKAGVPQGVVSASLPVSEK